MEENDSALTAWDKTDVIHFLSESNGYASYLEICSPTTGGLYHKIDRAKFSPCHRLMYKCPPDFDDNLAIDFRSADLETGKLIEDMHRRALRYDIVLVDSFHLYDISYRDLSDALSLIADGGTIVVHDCLPPSEDLVTPEPVPGAWCGASFVAFIDFVQTVRAIDYVTVDTDYGCGLIRKSHVEQPALPRDLRSGWESIRHDTKAAHRFMIENKAPLLHLVSVEEFKDFASGRRSSR